MRTPLSWDLIQRRLAVRTQQVRLREASTATTDRVETLFWIARVFDRVTGVACARYVLSDSTKAVSLAKCMKVPESCSAGVDEMREMASTIKTEVLTELKGRIK